MVNTGNRAKIFNNFSGIAKKHNPEVVVISKAESFKESHDAKVAIVIPKERGPMIIQERPIHQAHQ